MHSPLVSWSRMVFLAGIVLATALIIPTAWFPFQLGKVALFALLILITSVLFALGRGTNEMSRAHGFRLALLVGVLPLSYLLSKVVTGAGSIGISGYSVEVDTVLFTTIAALTFVLSFGLFRTLRTLNNLTKIVMWMLVGVVAFQWIVVLFGTSIVPFSIFSDRSINLVGKWNDFGILVGLLATIVIIYGDLVKESVMRRSIQGVGLAALVLLLGIVNFALVWWLVLAASIVVGLTAFFAQRGEERVERQTNPQVYTALLQKIPWFSAAGFVISVVFLLFGSSINQGLTSKFPISSLEVRPSYSSTYSVISAARDGAVSKALFGTGPNTFSSSWITHKPSEVNQSAFWNLDFNVGFSTLITALGTVGLVGAIAWLIPFLLVLASIVRAIRLSLLSKEERVTAMVVTLGSIFLLSSIVFYVPSPNLVLLAFVLSGATFGYLWRQGRHAPAEGEVTSVTMLSRATGYATIAVLIIVSMWGAWSVDHRLMAQTITNKGAASLQSGDIDGALAQAKSAQGVEITNDNLRLGVEAGMAKIQQIANNTADKDSVQKFTDATTATINTAKTLSEKYPNDYRTYSTLARIYDLLASLKVQGAYQNAELAYQKAITLNPTAPDLPLALARLEASQGNVALTQQFLTQSLTLKPNYTDAILLVVQLNVANNDIPSAVRAAQAAAQTAPGVAPIWFELGLLYYAGGDTKDAIAPLERAISIVPEYANAKYFLGLSYFAQGRAADALKQFEELSASNPSSAEVSLILNNLRSGKKPFDSAEPPITPKPAARKTAPLNE